MGLLDRYYYGKAGQRDYTEMDMPKTRIALFFQVLKDHFLDLIKVNFLQLVFWIPFLAWTYINLIAVQSIDTQTIIAGENSSQALANAVRSYFMMWLLGIVPCIAITGPSTAGAAYIMRNWARDQHAFLLSDFKDACKGNWKPALAVSAITSVVPVLTYTAVGYYGGMARQNIMLMLPLIIVLSAVFVWVLMIPLIYPVIIGYELPFRHMMKNTLIMAVASLPKMIAARLITFVPLAATMIGFYIGNGILVLVMSIYYILFGFAFTRLVYASFANGVFDKLLHPHIEGAEIRQGLRPQTDEDEYLDDDEEEEDEEDG